MRRIGKERVKRESGKKKKRNNRNEIMKEIKRNSGRKENQKEK